MAQHVESFEAIRLDRLDGGVIFDRTAEIDQLAVEARGDYFAPPRTVQHFADRGPAWHAMTVPVERYADLGAHFRGSVTGLNVAAMNAGISGAEAGKRWAIMNGRTKSWDGHARGAGSRGSS